MGVNHRRWRRTGAAVAATLVGVLFAALLPGSAALALPSGYGWSASWRYHQHDAFQYAGKLPGVRLTGQAIDRSGIRSTSGTIEDTADDDRCARVLIYAYEVGYVADRTTCGNGTSLSYSTGIFNQGLLVILYRMVPGTTSHDKGFHIFIPSSTTDPELRSLGTGADWVYRSPTSFSYTLIRNGVRLNGHGRHEGADQRMSSNAVQKTDRWTGCATAIVRGGVTFSGGTCTHLEWKSFYRTDLTGDIEVTACHQRIPGPRLCLPLNIPEPW